MFLNTYMFVFPLPTPLSLITHLVAVFARDCTLDCGVHTLCCVTHQGLHEFGM